jgi:hypothetical protein
MRTSITITITILTEVRRGVLQMKELDGRYLNAGACCLTRFYTFILPILVWMTTIFLFSFYIIIFVLV